MKVIYPDNISAITTNSQDASYPDDNVLTDYRTQVYKSATAISRDVAWDSATSWDGLTHWASTATATLPYLSATVTGPSSGIAIINTNADEVHVVVTDIDASTVLDAKYSPSDYASDLWIEYDRQVYTHTVKLTFLPPSGSVVEVGCLRIGTVMEFPNPVYGLSENMVDTSIIHELNNGAIYYKQRDIIREYSGKIEVARDTSFFRFMRTLFAANGQAPLAWLIAEEMAEEAIWVVFGNMAVPGGSHAYFQHSDIDFTIKESL